jgi:hypothetical protein
LFSRELLRKFLSSSSTAESQLSWHLAQELGKEFNLRQIAKNKAIEAADSS